VLDTYGVESYERERERVQIAIFETERGQRRKTARIHCGREARLSRRLFWADNPEEAKLDTPEKRKVSRQDLQDLIGCQRLRGGYLELSVKSG
jgi:hypothetical protein